MFTKIQERINKLLWAKQSAEQLLAQGKDFVNDAKAAVEDIKKDGIGMDDLAKVGQHFDNLKDKASDIVADAKEKVAEVTHSTEEHTEEVVKTTDEVNEDAVA